MDLVEYSEGPTDAEVARRLGVPPWVVRALRRRWALEARLLRPPRWRARRRRRATGGRRGR